ncbi:MAG: OsmC family protein [Candidatus Omnitrophica bacterium]|nr:OsmC family protein [Candidatus Omnitrophota bacterium]
MKAEIIYKGGTKFVSKTRDFEILTDLPEEKGGTNTAISPNELFIASIASCMGTFVAKYLKTIDVDAQGLAINVDYDFADDPRRIGKIDIQINIPKNEKAQTRIDVIKRSAEQCPMHNTLHFPPEINITINPK